MPKYYILGKDASVFWDPTTRTKIVSSDKSNPTEVTKPVSKRMALAIKHGHIVEVPAPVAGETVQPVEDKKASKSKNKKPKDMDDEELKAYYLENYEVSDEEMAEFEAMDHKAKVKYLS